MFFQQTHIFPTADRSHYRIPSMITTKKETVLAFCNDRKDSVKDAAAECDLVLCRKEKGGQWSEVQCLRHIPGWTHLIGTAIYDEITDTAMCSFQRIAIRTEEFGNYSEAQRRQIAEKEKQLAEAAGVALGQRLLVSTVDGKTWAEKPLELSPVVLRDPQGQENALKGYSHGSGAGIQLRHGKYAGRLICPAKVKTGHCTSFSEIKSYIYNLALFSDDHGKTWHSSQPVQMGTGEGTLIEREDGSILYNSRASFDDLGKIAESCFVLEQGQYTVSMGVNVRDAKPVLTFRWEEDTVVRRCHPYLAPDPEKFPKRLTADGSYEALPAVKPIKHPVRRLRCGCYFLPRCKHRFPDMGSRAGRADR